MKQDPVNRPNGIDIAFHSPHPESHDALITYLKKHGHRLKIHASLYDSENADLILIEADFPYFRIFKFLKRLQQAQSTACILVMGPELDSAKVSALLRGGVFDYLTIPFPLHRLAKTIQKGLKNRENLLNILNLANALKESNQSLSKERDQLKKWNDDLSEVYALNQTLSESLDIDQIVKSSFSNIQKVVSHDISCLYLKGWDQVRVEADPRLWGNIIHQVKDETRQDALKFIQNETSTPQARVCHGGAEIMVSLSVGTAKIGLLRLIRIPHRPFGHPSNPPYLNHQKTRGLFSEYQAKLLSMISVPLAIAIRNAEMYKQVEDLSVKDPLTNVLNRRSFSGILEREFRRANRYNSALTVMVIDLDHFKKVNDTYGHLAGDQILREIAAIFKISVRDVDVLIRYGGEEFVVILPGTNLREGLIVANRIRNRVNQKIFHAEGSDIPMTVSIGVAHHPSAHIQNPEALFKQADQALYRAKQEGRNRIMILETAASSEQNPPLVLEKRVV